MVQFSPFLIVTHLGFHVSITAVGVDLAGVWLDLASRARTRGSWSAPPGSASSGSSSGSRSTSRSAARRWPKPTSRPPTRSSCWRTRSAPRTPGPRSRLRLPGVALVDTGAGAAPGAELAAAPDGAVTVSQRAVPLGVSLDKLGDAPIGGLEAYTVESAAGSMPSSAAVQDWFAPGYFFELDSSEQLSAPSFERLDAGIEFGGGEPIGGPDLACTLDYEQILRDPELGEDRVQLGALPLATGTRVTMAGPGQARPRNPVRHRAGSGSGRAGIVPLGGHETHHRRRPGPERHVVGRPPERGGRPFHRHRRPLLGGAVTDPLQPPRFLPWLRSGLATQITTRAAAGSPRTTRPRSP